MCVANAVLKNRSDPEWRFYFMLCIYSYRDLAPCYPMSESIAQGLLAIAAENGLVTSAEAALYMDEFDLSGHRDLVEQSRGGFVLDLDLAVSDKEAARIGPLMDKSGSI